MSKPALSQQEPTKLGHSPGRTIPQRQTAPFLQQMDHQEVDRRLGQRSNHREVDRNPGTLPEWPNMQLGAPPDGNLYV